MKMLLFALGAASVVASTAAFAGTVTVSVSPTQILERQTAVFTFTNSPINPTKATRVRYYIAGDAICGFDYLLSGTAGEVVIPAGSSSAQVTLNAITDFGRGPVKSVMFDVAPGRGYKVGVPRHATVAIFEFDSN